jgi:hypothetical protein
MSGPIAGTCFDIDGDWWNGHGPGSGCLHCDAPETPRDPLRTREALEALAAWPCQKYNPPHDCRVITGDAPLPCGPCVARLALADSRPEERGRVTTTERERFVDRDR